MSDEPISVTVTRDRRDYVSALWANYFICGGWYWAAGASLFVGVFGIFIAAIEHHLDTPSIGSAFIIFAGTFLLVLLLQGVVIGMAAGRSMRAVSGAGPITYVFSPDVLEVHTPAGEGKTKWEIWRSAFETKRVIGIRHELNMLHIVPKRDIPAPTLFALKALLRKALKGKVTFKAESAT
ncbi:YcxB family protein [Terricaulis sp.]|uniref:YcxB family protein n=1 Tax=Terricaulis sp. TaxID=2768686 RepID=UPI0037836597